MEYQLTADVEGIKLFKRCVDLYIERWPGGDPAEQQLLHSLQINLAAMILEDTIENS